MFSRKPAAEPDSAPAANDAVLVSIPSRSHDYRGLADAVDGINAAEHRLVFVDETERFVLNGARAVISLFDSNERLSELMMAVSAERRVRGDGSPVLVIGSGAWALTSFGVWLSQQAASEQLSGVRLLVDEDPVAMLLQALGMTSSFTQPNTIAMPVSTEVETPRTKYFYCISPTLRLLLAQLSELAANNVERVYLLGGPGAGKTSLAYYFFLARQRGKFVTVNLTSESTGDKAAMKSLLCGHVAGAFPGAGSRTGAFSHARDGVCFLDESHGVSGGVMEVLMEALDSNQYLPYGASAKRPLECAVIFASNRNWDALVSQVNLDEHARLGAVIMHLADLSARPEDLIAVMADTLARLARKTTSWTAPEGLSHTAWQLVRQAPWRGNTRALIRVLESAFVESAMNGDTLIEKHQIQRALDLWEPEGHQSDALYMRSSTSGLGT